MSDHQVGFHQAKTIAQTRAKRIQSIFQAAFSEALKETKAGSSEVWSISKGTLTEVLELETPTAETETATPFWKSVFQALRVKFTAYLQQKKQAMPERYGDRYTTLKTRASQFTDWYKQTLAKGETLTPHPFEQKQSNWAQDLGQSGATVAQKEQQIKQQVKNAIIDVVAQ